MRHDGLGSQTGGFNIRQIYLPERQLILGRCGGNVIRARRDAAMKRIRCRAIFLMADVNCMGFAW